MTKLDELLKRFSQLGASLRANTMEDAGWHDAAWMRVPPCDRGSHHGRDGEPGTDRGE